MIETDPETSRDAFLGGRILADQPLAGYRAGIDAVLLAAATPAVIGKCERVLDAGAGVGVVGLAIAWRVTDARLTLVEIDQAMAALARSNVALNGLGERMEVVIADVSRGGATANAADAPASLAPGSFQHVVSNPPFYRTGSATPPGSPRRAVAHQMPQGGLLRWMAFLATVAAHGASLTLIHRADALDDILGSLAGRFGAVRILPIQPRADAAANRVLIRATKGSRAPLSLLPPFVLHDAYGRFLPGVAAILRDGAPLPAIG